MSDRDTIERAIRHIDSCLDVDPWARDIAIDAMQRLLGQASYRQVDCTDYISRQAAIDAIISLTNCTSVRDLYEYVQEHNLTDMWSGGVNDAIDAVIAVPSAQPERKKGYWKAGVWWKCSECGMDVSALYNYCPYCGADMRGEIDG